MKKRSIAVIQRFLPSRSTGGVGHFTHGLCNALRDLGHSVTVFSRDPAPVDARYRVMTLAHPPDRLHRYLDPILFPFQVATLNLSGFDLIHAQGDDAWISRKENPPVVRTLHGSAFAEAIHSGLRCLSLKWFCMHLYFYACELISDFKANAVVAVSKHTCRYYPKVSAVIPNGVDIKRFASTREPKSAVPSILFVGQMNGRKRGRFLLRLIQQRLLPRLPQLELWLVCPERVRGKGCRWFGSISDDALAHLYQQAWVFCSTSSYEGFGRPALEALASGTAVVSTRNPGAMELLQDGRCGALAADGDLTEILHNLLTHEALRADYSRRGLERARQYSWDKIAAQYERLYEKVLEETRGGLRAS